MLIRESDANEEFHGARDSRYVFFTIPLSTLAEAYILGAYASIEEEVALVE